MLRLVPIRLLLVAAASLASGCALIPDKLHQPQYHNPFPQLYRVAVLPFYNQSAEPTVNGEQVALAYYSELQAIPGFEVVPVGVSRRVLEAVGAPPRTSADFQRLAQLMNVDAVLVGSVTEFTPYYPPRLGLTVDWHAANPGFHEIPAGYGLPWGTAEEEFIPTELVQEAEFALARQQLKTQTPLYEPLPLMPPPEPQPPAGAPADLPQGAPTAQAASAALESNESRTGPALAVGNELPPDWPDPRGFVPPPPRAARPPLAPHRGPIISHTRLYRGESEDFTQRLANYFYFRDDARFGGWQSYLQRPDDFVRFCCHLHVTETLAARGGAGPTRVVWRWPIRRYER